MNSRKGITFILLSAVFFGSYGMWSRIIGDSAGMFSSSWVRGLIICLILIPFGFFFKSYKRIHRSDLKWFALVSFVGALSVAPVFYSFNKIGIGSSTLLFYAALTLTGYFLGAGIFKEKINLIKSVSLAFAMIGLIIIFFPYLNIGDWLAAACAIFAGIMGGTEVVFTKKLSDNYSGIQISTILYIFVLIINLVLSFMFSDKQVTIEFTPQFLSVIGYAVSSMFAFVCVVIGYKNLEPSIATIIGLIEILVGILLGLLLFNEILSLNLILGSVMIIISAGLPSFKAVLSKKS